MGLINEKLKELTKSELEKRFFELRYSKQIMAFVNRGVGVPILREKLYEPIVKQNKTKKELIVAISFCEILIKDNNYRYFVYLDKKRKKTKTYVE